MTGLFNWFAQIAVVTRLNLQTMVMRKGSSLAAMVGIAGVVTVLVGVLSIAQGFMRTMTLSGSEDNAIVLRGGSDSEMMSFVSLEDTRIIAESPAVLQGSEGPLASAELFVIVNLPHKKTGTDVNVPFRGVQKAAFEVRKDFHLVEGRLFEWGRNEVIAGKGAVQEFAGMEVGRKIELGKNVWHVVGIFDAGGGLAESELWTDAKVLQPAYQRGTTFQSVTAKLTSKKAFAEFKDTLTTDPRLNVKVVRESDFYAEQSSMLYSLIINLGVMIAGLMAIGAIFGALNTMYTAISARSREIATLRALGFRGGPVVISVLIESLILAAMGGIIGGGLAWLAFDGFQAATINWQSFSQVAFAFAVTPALLIQGIIWALVLGFIGGLFPAIRAARAPIPPSLRGL